MYGEGISKLGELLDLGVAAGLVEKSGSWFSYGEQRIGQGRENAKNFLRENPDMANELEVSIRQNAGLVQEKMMDENVGGDSGSPEDSSEDSPE
jgi:recombination protein RecA